MDPLIIRQRTAVANERISQRVEAITGKALVVQQSNDSALASLFRIEAVADVLDTLSSGVPNQAPGVLAGNVGEIRDAIGEIEDSELLEQLLHDEVFGDNRKGVTAAIEVRIEKLADADDGGDQ